MSYEIVMKPSTASISLFRNPSTIFVAAAPFGSACCLITVTGWLQMFLPTPLEEGEGFHLTFAAFNKTSTLAIHEPFNISFANDFIVLPFGTHNERRAAAEDDRYQVSNPSMVLHYVVISVAG
jgi:hypothetical protein